MSSKSTLLSPLVQHGGPIGFRIWKTETGRMAHAHTHPDVEVNFLIHGEIRYFHGGRFRQVSAGEIAIFWGGLPHQSLSKGGARQGIWMTIPLQRLLRWKHAQRLTDLLLKGDMLKYSAAPFEKLFHQWLSDFQSTREDLIDIVVAEMESHFSRLSLSLKGRHRPRRKLTPSASRIEDITTWLHIHYTEDIGVDDIGRAVGMHPKYILSLFRKTCQITLWEYVLRLRLAHAQRLLLTTDRTILDIALDSGFGSLSAFYHAFRKYLPDATPSERRFV